MMEMVMFGRRAKGKDMEPTDTTPPTVSADDVARAEAAGKGEWVTSADDRQAADRGSRLAEWTPEMDAADTVVRPDEQQWRQEGIPAVRPPYPARLAGRERPAVQTVSGLSARAVVPRPIVNPHREACPHCEGSGYVPSISDYLRESIALLGDQGDEVVRSFYGTLFRAAPDLVTLFPGNPVDGDLGSDHKGAKQREKLLAALVALSDLYDPDDADRMTKLDTALASFGRSHAAFVRRDGTIKGATWEEYGAVKDALFQTLVRAAGDAWKPEYTESWSQAYDYAAAVMLAEQYRSGFAAPRFPR